MFSRCIIFTFKYHVSSRLELECTSDLNIKLNNFMTIKILNRLHLKLSKNALFWNRGVKYLSNKHSNFQPRLLDSITNFKISNNKTTSKSFDDDKKPIWLQNEGIFCILTKKITPDDTQLCYLVHFQLFSRKFSFRFRPTRLSLSFLTSFVVVFFHSTTSLSLTRFVWPSFICTKSTNL